MYQYVCVCVCVCECVSVWVCCVCGGGGGGGGVCALVWTDIWGKCCDFNRISADTRGVGTSASRKTHANQRFIYF